MGNSEQTARVSPEVAQWIEGFLGGDWRAMSSWLASGLASVWVWFGLFGQGSRDPVGWFATLAESLGLATPGWIAGMPTWLASEEREWVPAVLVIGGAVAITVLARPGENHGLSVLGTLDLGILISVERSLDPLWWIVGLSVLPLLAAVALHAKRKLLGVRDGATWYFWDVAVLRLFLGLSVMWLPLILPVIVIAELVRSYGHTDGEEVVDDVRKVVRRLNGAHREGQTVNPVDLALLESCLARLDDAEHRWARASIQFTLASPTGAASRRLPR